MTTTLGARHGLDHDERIRREYPALLEFCRRLDWDSPEDLAQEATARTLQRLVTGDVEDIGAYLRTTARHLRADLVRAKFAHPVVVTEDLAATAVEDPDVVQAMALRQGLHRALSALSERELAVLCLADVDELSLDAIAAAVGATHAGVKSLLYRARQKARAEIERLKSRGMLAVAGPVSAFRSMLAEGGPNLAAGAATAVIAVAATLGLLSRADPAPIRGAAGASHAEAAHVIGLSPEAPPVSSAAEEAGSSGAPAARDHPRARPSDGDAPPPGRGPGLRPRPPDPWVRIDGDDRSAERSKPIYVRGPQVDLLCDGQPDPPYVLSDDPWAEEGRPVFDGSPPPGAGGQILAVDLAAAAVPSACGAP